MIVIDGTKFYNMANGIFIELTLDELTKLSSLINNKINGMVSAIEPEFPLHERLEFDL